MRFSNFLFFLLMAFGLTLTSCEKDDDSSAMPDPNGGGGTQSDLPYGTGLLPNGTASTTPVQANFSFGTGTMPNSVDLTQYLPPIGNQGTYGTCVAWAVGYNFKTAINAIEAGLSTSALADPSKQGSPRYLFTSVPDGQKSADCNGMLFDPAFDILQNKGLATQAAVPYENLGNCAQQLADPSWDAAAASNKVANYRRVDGSVEAIKRTLADKMPIVVGAKLGTAFQEWRGDGVLDTEGTFDPNFQHAYHAMAIVGYDNSKGANGAFRLVNSWGDWGDGGFIWIDYNFFMNNMLMRDQNNSAFLYIATNAKGSNPDDNQPTPPSGGNPELVTWMFDEYVDNQGSGQDRIANYDIYNFGDQAASAATNWDIYYVYYNAYDANDWGVLFHNRLTTSVTDVSCDDTGCDINIDLKANSSLGLQLFGKEGFDQGYRMPNISGEYFLMMVADGEEEIAEYDEFDNYFFPSLEPISIDGGVIGLTGNGNQNGLNAQRDLLRGNAVATQRLQSGELRPEAPRGNAYSPSELKQLLNAARRSGELDRKAAAARSLGVSKSASSVH